MWGHRSFARKGCPSWLPWRGLTLLIGLLCVLGAELACPWPRCTAVGSSLHGLQGRGGRDEPRALGRGTAQPCPGPARLRGPLWPSALGRSCLHKAGSFHKTFSNNQLWGLITTSSQLLFFSLFTLALSKSFSSPASGEWGDWVSQSSGQGWGLPQGPPTAAPPRHRIHFPLRC